MKRANFVGKQRHTIVHLVAMILGTQKRPPLHSSNTNHCHHHHHQKPLYQTLPLPHCTLLLQPLGKRKEEKEEEKSSNQR